MFLFYLYRCDCAETAVSLPAAVVAASTATAASVDRRRRVVRVVNSRVAGFYVRPLQHRLSVRLR